MRRLNYDGIVFYRFDGLSDQSGLDHALFTRHGGVSPSPFATLNLGHTVGDDLYAVEINHDRALAALGWRHADVTTAHLVHGGSVAVVGARDQGQARRATDALVTAEPGVVLMLRFADCVPILFFDQRRRAIGLAHAGWRGIPAQIVQATVAAMTEAFDSRPADIWAGIGPSIGPCCYEVGPEVVEQISAVMNGRRPFRPVQGGTHLDLWAAIKSQLLEAGVTRIEISQLCTACRNEDWFSHRAEKGKTGRFGVVIGLRP